MKIVILDPGEQESLVRSRERRAPDDCESTLAQLADVLLAEEKFKEAEPLARECLAIRERRFPANWRTFNARKMLGVAWLGQQKYVEAEPVLLSAYQAFKQREDKMPMSAKPWFKETMLQLTKLYATTERADKLAEWKATLAEWYRNESRQHEAADDSPDCHADVEYEAVSRQQFKALLHHGQRIGQEGF